jgi:hypothetical protein
MRILSLLSALALAFGGFFVTQGGTASADWCYDDPLMLIQGRILDFQVGIPFQNVKDLTGPVEIRVHVPKNVNAAVLLKLDLLYKTDVKIVRTNETWQSGKPVNVKIEMRAPARTSFNTSLLVTHTAGGLRLVDISQTTGKSNEWLTRSFKLDVPVLSLLW